MLEADAGEDHNPDAVTKLLAAAQAAGKTLGEGATELAALAAAIEGNAVALYEQIASTPAAAEHHCCHPSHFDCTQCDALPFPVGGCAIC